MSDQQKGQAVEFEIVPQREMPLAPPSEMEILRLAVERGAGIETIERLAALQEKMQARKAETEFNEALNRVQEKIKRIAPNAKNNHTNSMWATYDAIDRVVRPIYAAEGFSLSFTHAESNKVDHIRVICWVRRNAHKEPYQVDWPVSTQGPKGGAVTTPVQATGISDSYAKRYLVKDIFNIAIGQDDTDGNMPMNDEEVSKAVKEISEAKDIASLKFLYTVAYDKAREAGDKNAMLCYIDAKDKRIKELKNAVS